LLTLVGNGHDLFIARIIKGNIMLKAYDDNRVKVLTIGWSDITFTDLKTGSFKTMSHKDFNLLYGEDMKRQPKNISQEKTHGKPQLEPAIKEKILYAVEAVKRVRGSKRKLSKHELLDIHTKLKDSLVMLEYAKEGGYYDGTGLIKEVRGLVKYMDGLKAKRCSEFNFDESCDQLRAGYLKGE